MRNQFGPGLTVWDLKIWWNIALQWLHTGDSMIHVGYSHYGYKILLDFIGTSGNSNISLSPIYLQDTLNSFKVRKKIRSNFLKLKWQKRLLLDIILLVWSILKLYCHIESKLLPNQINSRSPSFKFSPIGYRQRSICLLGGQAHKGA